MHCQSPAVEPVFGFIVVEAGMKKPPLLARAVNVAGHPMQLKNFPSVSDKHLPG
jgi:hypothetical protein